MRKTKKDKMKLKLASIITLVAVIVAFGLNANINQTIARYYAIETAVPALQQTDENRPILDVVIQRENSNPLGKIMRLTPIGRVR
jgi:hypothetical protein